MIERLSKLPASFNASTVSSGTSFLVACRSLTMARTVGAIASVFPEIPVKEYRPFGVGPEQISEVPMTVFGLLQVDVPGLFGCGVLPRKKFI